MSENEESIKVNALRKVMINNLNKSINIAAQSTVVIEINMSKLIKARETLSKKVKNKSEIKLSYLHMLIYEVSRVLTKHPSMNSTLDLDKGEIIRKRNVNFGFAVAVERKHLSGLIIPVVHKANERSLDEIVASVNQLTNKAINKTISLGEMSGGTFTISSVGNFRVDLIQPLLRFPEGAILGVTKIKDKAIVVNGNIQIAPLSNFCITVDHRIIDEVPTYKFLEDLKNSIENIEAKDFLR